MKEVTYKYLEGKHLESLLNGNIFLNSFSNIRRLEEKKMNDLIGDQAEGLVLNKVDFLIIDPTSPDYDQITTNLKRAGGSSFSGGASGIIVGGKYGRMMNDAWMFCASRERDDTFWINQSNYDKCVKILDFGLFFERCAIEVERLNQNKTVCSYGDCKYEDIWGVVEQGTIKEPSFYRKSNLFESQKEQRAVFEPVKEKASYNLQPLIIKIKIDDIIEFLN